METDWNDADLMTRDVGVGRCWEGREWSHRGLQKEAVGQQ